MSVCLSLSNFRWYVHGVLPATLGDRVFYTYVRVYSPIDYQVYKIREACGYCMHAHAQYIRILIYLGVVVRHPLYIYMYMHMCMICYE